MSIEAITYALNLNVGDATRKLVLIGYANHAHKDGTCTWASVKTIAEYANCSNRTVQRHVKILLDEGYIREGDQRHVDHLRADKRPIVYDIAMSEGQREEWKARRGDNGGPRAAHEANGQVRRGDSESPRDDTDVTSTDGVTGSHPVRDDTTVSPRQDPRGDTGDAHGVTPVTPRGDKAVSPKPSKNHPYEPSSDDSLRSSSTRDAGANAEPGEQTELVHVEPKDPVLKFKTKRRLPEDFRVTKRMRAWFVDQGFTGFDAIAETEAFKDHHAARGTTMLDWERAWQEWMRRAQQYATRDAARGAGRPGNVRPLGNVHHSDDPEQRRQILEGWN